MTTAQQYNEAVAQLPKYNKAVRDLAAAQRRVRELESDQAQRGMVIKLFREALDRADLYIAKLEAVREAAKRLNEHLLAGPMKSGEEYVVLRSELGDALAASDPPQDAQEHDVQPLPQD